MLFIVGLACISFLSFLVFFARADGDLTLMSKGAPKHEEIEDKVVWITGASGGIGEALAKRFAGLGAKLILSARRESELLRVKSELKGKHAPDGIKILPLDLASGDESLKELVLKAEALFPGAGVDYMVHNAAFERPKTPILETSDEELKGMMTVNVFGAISITRHLTPFMLKRGKGHYIVMSSAAGKTPAPGQGAYSCTKHAMNGYFHSLRSELFQKGINVTVACPGPIETVKSRAAESPAGKKEKRVSETRCAELVIVAATHGLKEAWISNQPVLLVMYLVQYMPILGYWLLDKVGGKRVDAAMQKGNAYTWKLLFNKGKNKAS